MPIAANLFDVCSETFELATPFVISRGAKSLAETITVTLQCIVDGRTIIGRGEAVPYSRYCETVEGTLSAIKAIGPKLSNRTALQDLLPPGAARNALDCAFWDLEAKVRGIPAYQLAGLDDLTSTETFYTLSLASPEDMAQQALSVPQLKCLKLKLGGGLLDVERITRVRQVRPDARLVGDANEAWLPDILAELMEAASQNAIEVIEQPLPAGE
ncbi:MAG: enolase C-terminal domain-like protein, partial [Pseudomonadota bacterium]